MIDPVKHIRKIVAYSGTSPIQQDKAGISDQIIKLDGNENPFGLPSGVIEDISSYNDLHLYPDPLSLELAKFIARKEKLSIENVFISAGADELIDLLIRAFVENSDTVLSISPTFGMYRYLSEVNGVNFKSVSMKLAVSDDKRNIKFVLDQKGFIKEANKAKMIFLARPNNPDGQMLDTNFIIQLLQLNILVVIDEAYIEFANEKSLVKLIQEHKNLIILRTFSKAYALGGIRVGYGLISPEIRKILLKIKQPYNVNILGQRLALKSINSRKVKENITKIKKLRDEFHESLINLVIKFPFFHVHESQGSYILITFDNPIITKNLFSFLVENNVLTRFYDKKILKNSIRISVGKESQINKVINLLTKKETEIELSFNVDGKGNYDIKTGISFIDHMLSNFAVHGTFDLAIKAMGDIEIDAHHTIEDLAIVLGTAIKEAIGDKKGINRIGSAYVPMDESLAFVSMDLSGRPFWVIDIPWKGNYLGSSKENLISASLIEHFFQTLSIHSKATIHIKVLEGRNNHHISEAVFKAFARALDYSSRIDPKRKETLPTTKGILE
jgi:histidinol-phosphate aminotransferase